MKRRGKSHVVIRIFSPDTSCYEVKIVRTSTSILPLPTALAMGVVYHNETMISLNTEDSMAVGDGPVGQVLARPTLLMLINYYYYCVIGS